MSKDIIYREDAIKAINLRARIPHDVASAHYASMAINAIRSVPSADRPSATDLSNVYSTAYKSGYEKGKADRPQGDTVSRRYLLAEIDDLADEFSEVDENGLHSERWCGILDAKGVIVNAPLEADRPQGEWKDQLNYRDGSRYNVCSECGYFDDERDDLTAYNFCPDCGADMRKESK